jgi:exopolysaccharide biosynthesis operon protein EpsL
MNMRYRSLPWLTGALLIVYGAYPAWAESQDTVKLRSSLAMSNDDNFFKAPSSTAVTERITSQTMGINISLPYSLQRFELDASLTSNQYQTFSRFDYTAQNYNAGWYWGFTPQLHGSLTSTRLETLNIASDSVDPTQRNKNTSNTSALSAIYELGGPWQLTAGLSSTSNINERAVTGPGDTRSNAYNVGAQLALASGSSVGYSLQNGTGSNTNDFNTTSQTINGVWSISSTTSLNAHVTALEQRFATAPQFNFMGTSGALNVNWQTTGKTSFVAGWSRDLASYPTINTTYTQTDTFSAGPNWQLSAKTSLRLLYSNALRIDQGNPSGTPSLRQDRLESTSVAFSWEPRPFASLTASLAESRRGSNIANQDFVDHLASVSALFTF